MGENRYITRLVGPNIHANAVGYGVIAAAFEQAIGGFPGERH